MNIDIFNNYKIGIEFIDKEHYNLFLICSEAVKNITDRNKTFELVNDFNTLTIEHFEHEEKFMQEINYPYFKYHKEAHTQILKKLNNLIAIELTKDYNIFVQKYFIKTLDDILLKHTDHYDRQITDFIKNK